MQILSKWANNTSDTFDANNGNLRVLILTNVGVNK